MTIIINGIDLTKNIFAVQGVNEAGRAEQVKFVVQRAALLACPPPCLIGLEACSGTRQ